MGVYSNDAVDFAAIGAEMAATTANWMNATVQIVDPNVGDTDWDEWTNAETNDPSVVLWEGRARIQPISNIGSPIVGYAQGAIRQVRVQVPLDIDAGFIRTGLQIIVLDGGNDYILPQMRLSIVGAVNSSYAWLRTIACEVDLRSVADGGVEVG